MQKYHRHYSTRKTSQSSPIPGREQVMVKNRAGGYVFPVDDWTRLERFCVLGAEGGTYYCSEQKLVVENAQAVERCIQADGLRTVATILEISEGGRAPKNDAALFALAMCCGMGDLETRKTAFEVLPRVARISTHNFNFLTYVVSFRGWGRGLRDAESNWYNEKSVDQLAYQVVKYRQRGGWTHRDVLRLAHPVAVDEGHNEIFAWLTGKGEATHPLIQDFERVQNADTDREVVSILQDNESLPWETIPTQFLKSPRVWEALLPNLPMTAMIRNLGRMSSIELLQPMSDAARIIADKLRNQDYLRKARVHPLNLLVALKTYQQGHGMRGKLTWQPVAQIVDALDDAFYLSFGNVESTGKRTMLALDVSGSMTSSLAGMPLSCREGSSAMAMVTARTEPEHVFIIFSSAGESFMESDNDGGWGNSGVGTFDISPRERLDDIVSRTHGLLFGGTDCALPMIYAQQMGMEIDSFLIYTDNETWAGDIHPCQALTEYRQKSGIGAKLVTVGMTSDGFSIADPNDAGTLDCVGFSTSTPQLIADFVK